MAGLAGQAGNRYLHSIGPALLAVSCQAMHKLLAVYPPLLLLSCLLLAAPQDDKPYNPPVAAASDEGVKALQRIRVPQGTNLSLFAAEPLLAHPVAFSIDEKGRFFVAETFRLHKGVTDNRDH